MTGGGDLTVSNSTFSGNEASKNAGTGFGGAIYFDNGGNGGNVSITDSTFTNNIAHNSGGQGGALYLTLGSLTANFNRIVGNTSGSGSGLFVENNSGSIGTATNNWWGCNGGPGTAGCDTAVLGSGSGGLLTFNPWIVLTITASPNSIHVNQAATLTADFLHNSGSATFTPAQVSSLIGLPVNWGSAVKGTLSNPQTTIQANGKATDTFTANALGAGSAAATVDNETATANITITKRFNYLPLIRHN
jgi:hypothetical protein